MVTAADCAPSDLAGRPGSLAFSDIPFDHFTWPNCLSPDSFRVVREEVARLEWQNARSEEYLKDHSTSASTELLVSGGTGTKVALDFFRSAGFIDRLNEMFGVTATHLSNIVYLRMRAGFYNHVHSDENDFGELVRLILYISGEEEYAGGELVLHGDRDGRGASCALRFPANSMFGFRMDGRSYHSVKEVTAGERICLSLTYS